MLTNTQARLIGSAIALVAGALMANSSNLNINLSIATILIAGILFLIEYVRSQHG